MNFELGETFSSIKEDFGIYVFRNGDKYIGEWKGKKMDGHGIYMFHNPDVTDTLTRVIYLGEFYNGRFHGFGKLGQFHDNVGQMIYCGEWIEGKKANLGLHYYQHPYIFYYGQWASDMKHGEGKLVFPNGEFSGTWEADKRQGPGKLRKTEGGVSQVS